LAGAITASFGWTVDQFWTATPHELWAMIEARIEANKR
jgi:hypothetical protein